MSCPCGGRRLGRGRASAAYAAAVRQGVQAARPWIHRTRDLIIVGSANRDVAIHNSKVRSRPRKSDVVDWSSSSHGSPCPRRGHGLPGHRRRRAGSCWARGRRDARARGELRQGELPIVGARRGRSGPGGRRARARIERRRPAEATMRSGRSSRRNRSWRSSACRFTDKPHDQSFIEEYVNVSKGSGQALLDVLAKFAAAGQASGSCDGAAADVGHVGRRTVQLRVRRLEAGARGRVHRQQGRHLLQRAGVEGGARACPACCSSASKDL